MGWGSLPDWLNLIVLAGLALITWWYARSTREMAQTMKETHEMQAAPQLGIELARLKLKTISADWRTLSFELGLVNAGNYLLTIERVTLMREVPPEKIKFRRLRETPVTTNPALPLDLTPPGPRKVFECETNITKDAQNLRLRIEYKDFRGRSYYREWLLPPPTS